MNHLANSRFNGKKVLIVGLARTGVAVATLLKKMGALITITDKKELQELNEYIGNLSFDTDIQAGKRMTVDLLSGKDMVVVSPGVPKDDHLLQTALKKDISVISEIEVAYSCAQAPIIAVTGTNGKTTTSTMIYQTLLKGGKISVLAGNIGVALSEDVLESKEKDFIVAEISSFQLEWVCDFRPHIAVFLNITPDHLDRHENMEEYIGLKKRLYAHQTKDDYIVVNVDDPFVCSFAENTPAKKIYFSRLKEVSEGAFVQDNTLIARYQGQETTICHIDDLIVRGVHNVENALASIAVSLICGIDYSSIREAIASFQGIEHRMEFVRELHGIQFINDSKATNVGAVVKSLEGIADSVILIAGGVDKGNDYTPLKKQVGDKVKELIVIGDAGEKIQEAFSNSTKVVEEKTMKKAVKVAYLDAVKGDTVLLSPGCASFDMFKNYEERGKEFKEVVKKLRKKPFEMS